MGHLVPSIGQAESAGRGWVVGKGPSSPLGVWGDDRAGCHGSPRRRCLHLPRRGRSARAVSSRGRRPSARTRYIRSTCPLRWCGQPWQHVPGTGPEGCPRLAVSGPMGGNSAGASTGGEGLWRLRSRTHRGRILAEPVSAEVPDRHHWCCGTVNLAQGRSGWSQLWKSGTARTSPATGSSPARSGQFAPSRQWWRCP